MSDNKPFTFSSEDSTGDILTLVNGRFVSLSKLEHLHSTALGLRRSLTYCLHNIELLLEKYEPHHISEFNSTPAVNQARTWIKQSEWIEP